MGARHSKRREWSCDSSGAAGDGSSTTGKSFHRSLTASGKRRIRWSKLTRSHSDRTPAKLSSHPLTGNYGEASGSEYLQDYSLTTRCSFVSTACQTEVHSVSVMTQTEHDDLQGWMMIGDDHRFSESNFPSTCNQHDIVHGSNVDSSQKSRCRMYTDSQLLDVKKDSVKHIRLDEAKSRSFDKEAVCNGNHMQKCQCCTDVTFNPHSCTGNYLTSESDRPFGALEKKVVQLQSCICYTQRHREKHLSLDSDIKLLDKRKQSNSSESRSVKGCEHSGSVQMLQLNPIENAVDLGSSFGSLNSEDMMLDTEVDDLAWPSNVRSHHASADVGSSAHCCRSSGCLSSKCTAVSECHDYFGRQIKYRGNEIPQKIDSVGRKYFRHMQNESIESPNHSELVMITDNIKHAVNGWNGPDPVLELTPTTISSRYFMFDTCINLLPR